MEKNQPFFKISIFEMKTNFRLEILQTVANWKLSKMQLGRLFFQHGVELTTILYRYGSPSCIVKENRKIKENNTWAYAID